MKSFLFFSKVCFLITLLGPPPNIAHATKKPKTPSHSPPKNSSQQEARQLIKDVKKAYAILNEVIAEITVLMHQGRALEKASKDCFYKTKNAPRRWAHTMVGYGRSGWQKTKRFTSRHLGRRPNKKERERKKQFDELTQETDLFS